MRVGGIDLVDQIPEISGVPESSAESKVDYSADLDQLKYREKLNAVERLEHELQSAKWMLTQRQVFAGIIIFLSILWLTFIGQYLWHFGEVTVLPKLPDSPEIKPVSDAVMIALITTTTINVLGLLYIIARWLFPQPGSGNKLASTD